MPTRTTRDFPPYDATVQRSAKNVFDRAPVVIPQLFEDALPPWYRRRSGIGLGLLGLLGLAGMAAVTVHYGVGGTLQRIAHLGVAVMRTFARMAG